MWFKPSSVLRIHKQSSMLTYNKFLPTFTTKVLLGALTSGWTVVKLYNEFGTTHLLLKVDTHFLHFVGEDMHKT